MQVMSEMMKLYEKKVRIHAVKMDKEFYVGGEGIQQDGKPGDYLCISDGSEIFIIAAAKFEDEYSEVRE